VARCNAAATIFYLFNSDMAELLHFTIVEARIDGDALGQLEAIRAEAIANAPSVTSALLTTSSRGPLRHGLG
jgi:hypothetical protein